VKRDIYLEDFGEMLEKATIRQWHVQEQDFVTQDDTVIAFETAKAIMEAPSPVEGTVTKLYLQPGDQAMRDTALAQIEQAQ